MIILNEKEINDLEINGYIFQIGENKYKFLDKDMPDVIIWKN